MSYKPIKTFINDKINQSHIIENSEIEHNFNIVTNKYDGYRQALHEVENYIESIESLISNRMTDEKIDKFMQDNNDLINDLSDGPWIKVNKD